jgi:broad specificity phosphatase PhoE
MTKLFLIRHGETDWNKQGKYTGQMDISINETGMDQARKVAKEMKNLEPEVIYSSDLKRALETAQAISEELGIQINKDKRLREIHQGEWEGLHVNEIQEQYTNEFVARKENPTTVAAPGGESIGDVVIRVQSFLDEITKKHPVGGIVVASHGIVLGIIRTIAMGIPVSEVFKHIPENAKLYEVKIKK